MDELLNFISGGKAQESEQAMAEAIKKLESLTPPQLADLKAQYQAAQYTGDAQAAHMDAASAGPSAFEGIQTDPRLMQAQMDSLQGLQDIYSSGGLTATDKARLGQISDDEQTSQRGAREAILQNAQARGIGGSGIELANQLMSSQESARNQNRRDMDVASMAEERALQALMQSGQLGGQISDRQFGQQAQAASAKDAISQFNAANTQQANANNAGFGQQVGLRNADTRQDVSNKSTDISNRQQDQNTGAVQQDFSNKQGIAQAQSDIQMAKSKAAAEEAARRQKMVGDAISGAVEGAANIYTGGLAGAAKQVATKSDRNAKKNIEKFDAGAMLDKLVPSKYKYKDPSDGDGEQVGIMAQDLEKGAPQMVEDTPDGKVVDYNKAGGPIFASLANLHERLKKMEGK